MTAPATPAAPAPFATCDLCDAHKDGQTLRVLPPVIARFGLATRGIMT